MLSLRSQIQSPKSQVLRILREKVIEPHLKLLKPGFRLWTLDLRLFYFNRLVAIINLCISEVPS
jgi:hypothetical protein